ncbi:Protein DCT-10 [Aphelenchoides avenae]|nr:Protein DCT-10 [Aphelenchus avenae]
MLLSLPDLKPFTGEGTEPFSHWLRRFNDHAEAREKPWTDAEKLRKLKAFLRRGPREKWDEFTDNKKATFVAATNKLKSVYENTFSKNIAKLNLVRCRQRPGESVGDFVERLRKLVKAATAGSTTDVFKERFLEEFLDRIDDDIGFHVKALMPNDMGEGRSGRQKAVDVNQIVARVVAALNLHEQHDKSTRLLARRIQCQKCIEWGHIRRDCYHETQGWYDMRRYDDYQRSNGAYYVDDGHNGRCDSGYVNRY